MITTILASLVLTASPVESEPVGSAYSTSLHAGTVLAGTYSNGDKAWDEKNREWLDSDSEEPYPEDLTDIDGDGYRDAVRASS